jgi:hypothetical protein
MSGFDEGPRWPERDVPREPDREPPPEPWRPRWQQPFEQQPPEPQPEPPPPPAPEPEPPPPPAPEPEPEPEPAPREQDHEQEEEPELQGPPTESAPSTTSLGGPSSDDWDPRRDGDRRRPTTAEQAVPWLIGLLLALSGIVVVLLALIFIGPDGVSGLPSASPSPSASAQETVSQAPATSSTPSPSTTAGATPEPAFGALEMTFLGRAAAASPIRLSRRDFSTTTDPIVLAEDANGVGKYAWAPDGRVGAAIISGRAVAIVAGQEPRTLTEPVDALVFADDSTTLYGVRIVRDGANDRAEMLSIDFESGATEIVNTATYPRPEIIADPALKEAQFADNGGIVRLYVTTDGYLVAWILGAPAAYRIDPSDRSIAQIDKGKQPVLWSPDRQKRIDVTEQSGTSTLSLMNRDETAQGSVKVTGLVSHIRWAASSNEIVFTLGRLVGGGVRQDLYVWDLVDGQAPSPLTSNGASFAAEWLGVLQSWVP